MMVTTTRPTREEIDLLYNGEQLSTKALTKRLHCSQTTLMRLMRQYGIKTRPRGVYYPHPQSSPKINYVASRAETGICEICGQPTRGHPQCRRCSILIGPNHYETAIDKRGLCGHCQQGRRNKEAE